MRNKHLHPLALLMFLGQLIKAFFFSFIFIVLGSKNIVLLTSIVLGLLVVFATINYFTFTYSILPNELFIKTGLIFKKQRHIPYDRIQTIQNRQWFFLRPFGVEEVIVNTAGSDKDKSRVSLLAVKTTIAPIIEKYHLAATHQTPNLQSNSEQPTSNGATKPTQYQIKGTDIFVFGLTDIHFIGELLALLAIIDRIHISFNQIANFYSSFATSFYRVLESIITFIILLMAIGVVKTAIKFYKFTLTKSGNHLIIEKGFFQRKTINLPIDKIQSVIFKQNAIRQLFHLTTVQMDLVTDSDSDDEKQVITVMPVVKDHLAYHVVNQFIGLIPKQQVAFRSGDGYSQWLFARNGVFFSLLFFGPLTGLAFWTRIWPLWSLVLTLFVVSLAIGNGIYKGRVTAAKQISTTQIAVQTARLFTKETQIVNWHQIQSMNLRQSIWMEHSGRAHLSIAIRRGYSARMITYRYLPKSDGQRIFDWYRNFANKQL
ncbi:PH domain-containing protein [Lactobacillus sp. Sy-1]|uniref:PH domain-containing protein n=1 Tax=Lactobacillus sp. Sy-1 TaxID=2109645 RepID=UPI001C56F18E|nr:PH domain-containing protein [Lactobacillus sp. Sy-1]MBW1604962.1 PH domain-containing protein [Lactobacillus sp. Sy-1]